MTKALADLVLLTKSDYARHRNLSAGRISQLIKAGRLTAIVHGLIDRDAADLELDGAPAASAATAPAAATSSPASPAASAAPISGDQIQASLSLTSAALAERAAPIEVEAAAIEAAPATLAAPLPNSLRAASEATLADERVKTERVNRELKQIELAERRGELVSAADVETAYFDLARQVRDKLLAIPLDVAPDLVGMTDVVAIRLRLTAAIEAALRGLASNIQDAPAAGKSALARGPGFGEMGAGHA